MKAMSAVNVGRLAGMLLFCSILMLALPLAAQRPEGGRGGRMDPEQMRQRMKERAEEQYKEMCQTLKLDDEQQEKADKLFAESQKENDKLFAKMRDENLEPRDAMGQMREAQEKFMDDFGKLLNEKQKEQFEIIKKERQERMERRRRN